jgi:hypothetical protein
MKGVPLTLRRHSGANLDIGFLDHHSALERSSTCAAVLCSQGPLAVSIRESGDGNNANATLVVAAISGAEANSPSRLRPSAYKNCETLVVHTWRALD